MNKTTFIIAFIFSITFNCKSQSMKLKNWAFKYEVLPENPLPSSYKTYKVASSSEATDGVPQSDMFVNIGEEYIRGYKNISVVYVKSGVMIGGAVIGGKAEEKKIEEVPDLMITVVFRNIEMLDKQVFIYKTTNLQTNLEESYYTYKLFFKFPYTIRMKDSKTGKVILDTLINTEKVALFPNDYRFDVFGNKIANNGVVSKPALDMEYNKNEKDIYVSSKKVLAKTNMNEAKLVLKSLYGFDNKSTKIILYHVKSKDKMFDVCDTAEDLLRSIVDTTTSNAKNERHVNWHCKTVKSDAVKLIRIWETMLKDPKYINVFENSVDKSEFTYKIKRDLVLAYLFNDEFEKANKLYNEIGDGDETMSILGNLIRREIRVYDKHKIVFGFD